jgi:hypothetical protein
MRPAWGRLHSFRPVYFALILGAFALGRHLATQPRGVLGGLPLSLADAPP